MVKKPRWKPASRCLQLERRNAALHDSSLLAWYSAHLSTPEVCSSCTRQAWGVRIKKTIQSKTSRKSHRALTGARLQETRSALYLYTKQQWHKIDYNEDLLFQGGTTLPRRVCIPACHKGNVRHHTFTGTESEGMCVYMSCACSDACTHEHELALQLTRCRSWQM